MTLSQLCRKISMPAPVTDIVLAVSREPQFAEWVALGQPLRDPTGGTDNLKPLYAALEPDPDGFRMLACQLGVALKTLTAYRAAGIPDEIFFATMDCFPRFVGEHKDTFGNYGFDREWWTYRQLSMRLFRIGELEFEIMNNTQHSIDIHIPSNADLTPDKPLAACRDAAAFFKKYGYSVSGDDWSCFSWLLSPDLPRFLPAKSRILALQALFTIGVGNEDDRSYRQWLFKNRQLEPQDFPETTSLQRSVKAFVLSGNNFRSGHGHLKPEVLL